jgi:NAD(P)-dependent dehydrogenase (short-subunit alcohol dehydrogenase family)
MANCSVAGPAPKLNNSSVYGLGASTVGHVPYAVSKHGVIGLTKTAAFEYAKHGIRVNVVCPGYAHSEMVDSALEALPKEFEKILNDVPMGRIAETEEITAAVLCYVLTKPALSAGTL